MVTIQATDVSSVSLTTSVPLSPFCDEMGTVDVSVTDDGNVLLIGVNEVKKSMVEMRRMI